MDSHLYRYLLTGEEPNFALPKKNDKIEVKQGRTMVQVDRYSDDEDGKLQLKRDCDDIEADRLKYRLSKPRAMEYLDTYVEESIGYQITMFEDYKIYRANYDVKKIYGYAKAASTGMGADSLYINIKALLD